MTEMRRPGRWKGERCRVSVHIFQIWCNG